MLTFEDETVPSPIPRVNGVLSNVHMLQNTGPMSSDMEPRGNDVATSEANSNRRISVEDKRIIYCKADVNNLVPFKYKWAWELYIAACANHWMTQ
jgi:ribonucleoside-diphosphate reductase beta chain